MQTAERAHAPAAEARHDREYAHLYRDLSFDPIFIIGDHRSGTTVLYQLLAATGAFNILTAYDIVCYDRLVANHVAGRAAQARAELARRFAELGLTDRGIDGVVASPDSPDEYGYIIDRSSRPQVRPGTRDRLIEVCQKLRFVGGDRPVLLKSPWDVLTFAYIKSVLPRARFVFVHRHPLHVMNSQAAALRSVFARRNEYVAMLSPWYRELFSRPVALAVTRAGSTERFGIGAAIVGRHVTKATRYYLRHIGDLPPQDVTELRYEDLCESPERIIANVLGVLGLESERPLVMRHLMQPRGTRILPDVLARYRRIGPRLAQYCARHGYDLDLSGPLAPARRDAASR